MKCVFPVAGRGSRVGRITDFIPKEMMPILDKPLIHYAIEEAINAGICEFIFIMHPEKYIIMEYIESTFCNTGCSFSYVNQLDRKGLGDAILCAKHIINCNEPFIVVLPDDLVLGNNCILEMLNEYKSGNMIATQIVSQLEAKKYGIFKNVREYEGIIIKADGIIEKPQHLECDMNYAAVGRYILDGHIIETLLYPSSYKTNEVQLSDAIDDMAVKGIPLYGVIFSGKKIDCGSKNGVFLGALNASLSDNDCCNTIKRFIDGDV